MAHPHLRRRLGVREGEGAVAVGERGAAVGEQLDAGLRQRARVAADDHAGDRGGGAGRDGEQEHEEEGADGREHDWAGEARHRAAELSSGRRHERPDPWDMLAQP